MALKMMNLTPLDIHSEPLKWILTKEEKIKAIDYAIAQAKKNFAWKLSQIEGMTVYQIEKSIAKINWMKKINANAILKSCNENKHQDLFFKEQRRKEKETELKNKSDLIKSCTAKYMYELICKTSFFEFNKRIILNDDTKELIKVICFFMSRDERFETELKFDLNKGLWLRGKTGLGKTHIVKCLRKNELSPVSIFSMIDITEYIKENGLFTLPDYETLYLDDVGTEELDSKNYGSKITFFKNFMEQTYLRKKTFGNIIISTNSSFSEIETRYGFRVRSRVKDMFNVFNVKGVDLRGKQEIED